MTEYPRLAQLGIPIQEHPVSHIRRQDLQRGLEKHGLDRELFGELFGIQTMAEGGPYPWDVESVLERMLSGKRKGSQLLWD